MKTFFKVLVATLSAVVLVLLGVGYANANATPLHCSGSQTATITNDPDSGGHGTWATDTSFTRTTTVKADCSGVLVQDSGAFKTIKGAQSPRDGVALGKSVAGTFTGKITLTFVPPQTQVQIDASLASLPKKYNVGSKGSVTGYWATQLKATEDNDWTWTYTTGCEKWVDAFNNGDGANSKGDITAKVCPAPPVTSTPAPPASTTTAPPVASGTGTGGASGTGSSGTAQVAAVPVGAPETGGGATAVDGQAWEYALWGATVLALAGLLFGKQAYRKIRKPSREG